MEPERYLGGAKTNVGSTVPADWLRKLRRSPDNDRKLIAFACFVPGGLHVLDHEIVPYAAPGLA
jgi:hypothetical protein